MNRLNEINRNGIYPVVKETLQAIEDNFQVIAKVLDGLNLPKGTAVVLQGLTYITSYMYLQTNSLYPSGKIVKVVGTGLTPTNQSSNMNNLRSKPEDFVMSESNVNTTIIDTDGVTEYPDCIVEEQYSITYSESGNATWKYYTLEEVLGLKRIAVPDNAITLSSASWSIAKNNCFVRPQMKKNHIHIDLEIMSNQNLVQGEKTLQIGGEIANILNQLSRNGTYSHPVQVSAAGFLASGFIAKSVADTDATITCYLNSFVSVGTNKMQITGDICL